MAQVWRRTRPVAFGALVAAMLLHLLACLPPTSTPLPPSATPAMPTATPNPTATLTPSPEVPSSLWYLTRGGIKLDQGWGVDTNSQGNVYFGTHRQPPDQLFPDMVIYKFSPDGRKLWQVRWGGRQQEKLFIVTVAEPYVYVGGLTHTAVDLREADLAVLALNTADGQIVWEFTWGQGFGYEEVDGLVADGDYLFVSGWTTGKTTGNDIAILKLDKKGKLIWAKTWGTPGWDQADGQMVLDADTIYLCGRYNAPNMIFGGEAFVAKFSKATGDYLAHRTWGGPAFDDALGMTSDGTYLYVVGLTLSFGNGGQVFLLKYDKGLNLIWDELWGGPAGESARAIKVNALGHIFVAGQTDSYGSGENDITFLKYSQDGQMLWSQAWGGPKTEGANGLAIDGDWAYIAGKTFSFGNGADDAILIKVNSQTGQFPPPGSR